LTVTASVPDPPAAPIEGASARSVTAHRVVELGAVAVLDEDPPQAPVAVRRDTKQRSFAGHRTGLATAPQNDQAARLCGELLCMGYAQASPRRPERTSRQSSLASSTPAPTASGQPTWTSVLRHVRTSFREALMRVTVCLASLLVALSFATDDGVEASPPVPPTVRPIRQASAQSTLSTDVRQLRGRVWVVQTLDDHALLAHAPATLRFGEADVLTGHASCNSYRASYELRNGRLHVRATSSTLRACHEDVMRQEDLFLHLLANVERFTLRSDGALILTTHDGHTIRGTPQD
jgi:heat shock protein HslJ